MRKQVNRVLLRFGYLITKAPRVLAKRTIGTSDTWPIELTEPVTIYEAPHPPTGELYESCASGTDVFKWHHYFEVYTRHLQPYRSNPITLLEIGVFRGGSMRMWKEFFHPGSVIVGIDIDENCRQHEISEQQMYVRIGSQDDREFLAAVNREFGPFDIILDDGSHQANDQLTSFAHLFRFGLKNGGCYVVEDTHTNYWASHVDTPQSFIEVSKEMVDVLHEPYFHRGERSFRHRHPDAVSELRVSYLAANLDRITFYDSIVVFNKRLKHLPKSEQR